MTDASIHHIGSRKTITGDDYRRSPADRALSDAVVAAYGLTSTDIYRMDFTDTEVIVGVYLTDGGLRICTDDLRYPWPKKVAPA